MNEKTVLIEVKGEDRTAEIREVKQEGDRCRVTFNSGKSYPYNGQNVRVYKRPQKVDLKKMIVRRDGKIITGLEGVYRFGPWTRIFYSSGLVRAYPETTFEIGADALKNKTAGKRLTYLKQVAEVIGLKQETEAGEDTATDPKGAPKAETNILLNRYNKITRLSGDLVLSAYLNESSIAERRVPSRVIYPYGCNRSQREAVQNALGHQVSVIQGPPGTGKTQTILNIIANLVMMGKTVQVVSNNNSATLNIREKMAAPGNDVSFIVAALGKSENRQAFIEGQKTRYPNWKSFILKPNRRQAIEKSIDSTGRAMDQYFASQEERAGLRRTLGDLELENRYFMERCARLKAPAAPEKVKNALTSQKVLKQWHRFEEMLAQNTRPSFWQKLKCVYLYGVMDWKFYKGSVRDMIAVYQQLFYRIKIREVTAGMTALDRAIKRWNQQDLTGRNRKEAMALFKNALAQKYKARKARPVVNAEDLWKHPEQVLAEYPVVLSSTYSSTVSLGSGQIYDYVIMDEASQVDVVTGALALSNARNAVIVGDTMQLPNVLKDADRKHIQSIFESFRIPEAYNDARFSFLESVTRVFKQVPQTLLKEHYRCHPAIIQFCNQKFYHNALVIMTADHGEKDVVKVYQTVPGSHERERMNQRQIDEIVKEIIPDLKNPNKKEIGVIAPFNKQVDALKREPALKGVEVETVHKFQGREKDDIIISTVENTLSDFTDNANLLNVAVSRAKKHLRVIVADSALTPGRNITDLVKYTRYHNFEVVTGKVYSIFDLLYKEYYQACRDFLKDKPHVSRYDSENLMYTLIRKVLAEEPFQKLDVVFEQPLNMVIRIDDTLSPEETEYILGGMAHVDFMIFNRMDKKPVLAIEVDGWQFHKEGSEQYQRDRMKDTIFYKVGIPQARFVTNASGEEQRLRQMLTQWLHPGEPGDGDVLMK